MKIEAEELKIRKALNLGGKATEYAGTIEELIADVSSLIQSEQARAVALIQDLPKTLDAYKILTREDILVEINNLLEELSPNKDIKE